VIPYIEGVIRNSDKKEPVEPHLQEKILNQLKEYFQANFDLDDVKEPLYIDYLLKYKFYQNQQLVFKIPDIKSS
jgi:hypothetical protein